jgi:LmbE family N-acetylglucosaminyl deacetylase
LLGVVADPNQAADLTGDAFAHYAASGTEVTLVCAGGRDWRGSAHLPAVRRLGVHDLVLLDYDVRELSAVLLEDVVVDVMAGVRPHVVVADGTRPAIREAVTSAFARARRASGGSSALPAKLYYRLSGSSPVVSVTTAIHVPSGPPELFVRVFPDPWVTGVLERDLFAGIAAERPAPPSLEQQLAG